MLERALTAQEIQTEMSMPWCSPMILHLGFNEGHGHTIHDSSANRLDVHLGDESPFHAGNVLSGEPAWATGRDAVCGTAMELKGNATTDVGDCFEIEGVPFGQAVTISMWAQIRTGGTGGPGGGGQLVNCHGDGGNGGGHSEALVLESSAGNWQARTWLQGMVSTNPSPPNNAVQAPYEAGVWTHLTMVYDDSETPLRQLILYVDGRPYYGSAKVIWQNMLVGGGGFCSIGCHPGAGRDGIPGQAFFDVRRLLTRILRSLSNKSLLGVDRRSPRLQRRAVYRGRPKRLRPPVRGLQNSAEFCLLLQGVCF